MKDLSLEEIKQRVKERKYTDLEWNKFQLHKFVDYTDKAVRVCKGT